MNRWIYIIAILGCFVWPIAVGAGQLNQGIAIRTVAPQALDDEVPNLAIISYEGTAVPLKLSRTSISTPIYQRKASSIQVFDLDQLTSYFLKPSKGMPAPLYEIPIGADVKSCLLVFERPREKSKNEWTLSVIPDDGAQFPGNSRLFVNFTDFPVSGEIEQMSFNIPPEDKSLVQIKANGDEVSRKNVSIFTKIDGRDIPIDSARWTFSAQARVLIFILSDNGADQMHIMGYMDAVPDKKL